MDLTKEQKKQLKRMGDYFKKIEKKSQTEDLELDVFNPTEQVNLTGKAKKRKEEFLKAGKEKGVKKTIN